MKRKTANSMIIIFSVGVVLLLIFFNPMKKQKLSKLSDKEVSFTLNEKDNSLELYYWGEMKGNINLKPVINEKEIYISKWEKLGNEYKGHFTNSENQTGIINVKIDKKTGFFVYWTESEEIRFNQLKYFPNSTLSIKRVSLFKNKNKIEDFPLNKPVKIELKNLEEEQFMSERIAVPLAMRLHPPENKKEIKLGMVILDTAYEISYVNLAIPVFDINFEKLVKRFKNVGYSPVVCVVADMNFDKDVVDYKNGFYKKYYQILD